MNNRVYYANHILTIYFFAVICFIAVYSFIYIPDYETFQISDWMINYEGGFVRRGLIGQLLLWANHIHSFNIRYAILIIEAIFYILFFYLLFNIFKKYRWSLLGAMFPIACSTTSMAVYRRDFMMLCLCYFSYKFFFKYLKENKKITLIISLMIMSISIIIYEPIFFVLVPILILQYWNKKKNLVKLSIVFFIPILCMVLSCIFSGTKDQVNIIWQSWLPYISENDNIGQAIEFIGLTNTEVFKLHYNITYGTNPIMSIFSLIIVLSIAYYLCTHIPNIDYYKKIILDNRHKYELSNILLFQLLVQCPLLIILSTDYGRTIPMCLYTTFFLLHFSNITNEKIYVTNIIVRISNTIINFFNFHKLFSNPWIYIIAILLFPFNYFVPSLLFDNIIVHSYEKIIKYFILSQ